MQVGNALTDDYHDHLGIFEFMWAAGLISDQTYEQLNLLCDFQSFIHSSESCDQILDVASEELGVIDPYSIYTPPCNSNVSRSNKLLKRIHVSGIFVNCLLNFFFFFYCKYIHDLSSQNHFAYDIRANGKPENLAASP